MEGQLANQPSDDYSGQEREEYSAHDDENDNDDNFDWDSLSDSDDEDDSSDADELFRENPTKAMWIRMEEILEELKSIKEDLYESQADN